MPQFQNFTSEDKIIETQKVTKGFFTGDLGNVTSFITGTLSASQNEYYLNMRQSGGTADEFSVAFGSYHGSASTDTVGQSKAVYWSMANLLLFPNELETQGFTFSSSAGSAVTQNDVYFLVAERARMKDRLNRKNWTLSLSGSTSAHVTSGTLLELTDDSDSAVATPTPVGPRYNIVSGSGGTVKVAATTRCYGHFYPNLGIMALSAQELSHSIGGVHKDSGSEATPPATGVGVTGNGFGKGYSTTSDREHYRLATAIIKGKSFTLRNEEDKLSTQYFVRAKAAHWNFSVNPTFSSGSTDATFRISEMTGNPTTFVTTIGLYDGGNNLVAVGKLTGAKVKSFVDEIICKVVLDH